MRHRFGTSRHEGNERNEGNEAAECESHPARSLAHQGADGNRSR
jgi:hypothetical protein